MIAQNNTTVGDLLRQFPGGFTVSASGHISEILLASSRPMAIMENYPVPPPDGGYLVVQGTDIETVVLEEVRKLTVEQNVGDVSGTFTGVRIDTL